MSASVRNIVAWILQVLLGLLFIFSGFNKLSNLSVTTTVFESMNLPGVFVYLIGGCELLGGIALMIPRLTRLAVLGLLIIMIGAVIMHIVKIPGGLANGIPAVVCLVLLGVLLWLRGPVTTKAV